MTKAIKKILEDAFDKYSFTRGYPHGDTKTRDNAVAQATAKIVDEFRKIVPEKKYHLAQISTAKYETDTDSGFNQAITEIEKGLEEL